jgi:hypothetical protein
MKFVFSQNGSQPFRESHVLERHNREHIFLDELLCSEPGNDSKVPCTSKYCESQKVSRLLSNALSTYPYTYCICVSVKSLLSRIHFYTLEILRNMRNIFSTEVF